MASEAGAAMRIVVLGATGYTGVELLRILARHPRVRLTLLSSEQYRDKPVADVYPFLAGIVDRVLAAPDPATVAREADVAFTALPHGAAAKVVADLVGRGVRVIDLSADFRLHDATVYARWYGEHPVPSLLAEAVYGLPELHREKLKTARLVANPGCYPTGAVLGLAPLARAGLLGEPVVIDAKSGTTGAGRGAKIDQLFAEVNENFRPYAIGEHRHGPEIQQELDAAGATAPVLFVPHLLPVSRGILSTMYVRCPAGRPPLEDLYRRAYAAEPFIVLRGEGPPPELREVRGTNRCAIGWRWDAQSRQAVIVTAIDNLGKGAAGQAVQCLNLWLGIAETTALDAPALVP
jgi:N-acetyl-gamma-glutamyl-phosphate reductase